MKRFLVNSNDEPGCSTTKRQTLDIDLLIDRISKINTDLPQYNLMSTPDRDDLDLTWLKLLDRELSEDLLQYCEENLTYFSGDLAKVRVFGKYHPVPRKQVAFGPAGSEYRFSGTSVTSSGWDPVAKALRDVLALLTGVEFNFCLVNRYASGQDYIAEHRDNEAGLDLAAPIASLTIGQTRDFLLRHAEVRKGLKPVPSSKETVKLPLSSGDLLLMNPPTNTHWYHSLPRRAKLTGVRVNFTFRKLKN